MTDGFVCYTCRGSCMMIDGLLIKMYRDTCVVIDVVSSYNPPHLQLYPVSIHLELLDE